MRSDCLKVATVGKSLIPVDLIALVDIGSNAVRFVLARLDGRPGFEVLARERVQTRLGASPSDALPEAAIEETLKASKRFLKQVRRDHGDVRVLAIATAATRDAVNREALLAPLAELGVQEVRILSGEDEGRLGAEAALRALPVTEGVVVDLGGGSLQVSRVQASTLQPSTSVPLGVARLLRRFLTSDPPRAREIGALRVEVRTQLTPLFAGHPPAGTALVSGGTVNALARLALVRRDPARSPPGKPQTHGTRLGFAELAALCDWLEPMTLQRRASERGVEPERADVIVACALVLEELLALSGYEELTVSRTSVREGVLWQEAAAFALPLSSRQLG
jgi:exopolyphosphatase / guanosine-5'-triphosphate,3'-diphosphate pyrophosphatase